METAGGQLTSGEVLPPDKPRFRVPAVQSRTVDSFANFETRTGVTTDNPSGSGTYVLNPISRNRQLLDMMYRGTWIVRQAVDLPAKDMTRAGFVFHTVLEPEDMQKMSTAWTRLQLWSSLKTAVKWSRLYGGSIAVIMIEGQDPATPLRPETIGRGQFKGLHILDRWMAQPSNELISEQGPSMGKPEFYLVTAGASAFSGRLIHYTRVVRLEGPELPFYGRQAENGWGLSIAEPLYDRLVAFDSTTQGMAQLVYKAHLRTLKVPGLRNALATAGPIFDGMVRFVETIKRFQVNEGMSLIDGQDDLQVNTYNYAGLSEVLNQFGQQICGAVEIPAVLFFGQSPKGMNSTGDSDIRLYYDKINSDQESILRPGCATLLDITSRSELGKPLPDGFDFGFSPLWQMSATEKATNAATITTAVAKAFEDGMVSRATALRELKQSSKETGVWSNITDEDIEEAENDPPPGELAMMEAGAAGATAGDPPGAADMIEPHDSNAPGKAKANAGGEPAADA